MAAHAAVVDPGDIYIADPGVAATPDGQILSVPAGGGAPSVIVSGLVDPVALVEEADGNLVVVDRSGLLLRVDVGAETVTGIAAGLGAPEDIAIEAAGTFLVLEPNGAGAGLGEINRYDTDGTLLGTVASGPPFLDATGPFGMALEAGGATAVVTLNSGAAIIRVTVATGAQAAVVGSLGAPRGIAVDTVSGDLIFADPGAGTPGLYVLAGGAGPAALASGGGSTAYALPTGVASSAADTAETIDPGPPGGLLSQADLTAAAGSNQTGLSAGAFSAPEGIEIAIVPEPMAFLGQGAALLALGLVAARARRR